MNTGGNRSRSGATPVHCLALSADNGVDPLDDLLEDSTATIEAVDAQRYQQLGFDQFIAEATPGRFKRIGLGFQVVLNVSVIRDASELAVRCWPESCRWKPSTAGRRNRAVAGPWITGDPLGNH